MTVPGKGHNAGAWIEGGGEGREIVTRPGLQVRPGRLAGTASPAKSGFLGSAIAGVLALLWTGCGLDLPPPELDPRKQLATTGTRVEQESPTQVPPVTVSDSTLVAGYTGDTPGTQPLEVAFKLAVSEVPADLPAYDRSEWPHWSDEDGDCQDARQETLIAESTTPVRFKTDKRCRVDSGLWKDPYTGLTVDDPGELDVDHVVPLANAHRSGAWGWNRERKKAYANDLSHPEHLLAVTASANRAKGRKGPEEWRPDNKGYWCDYAQNWAGIKTRWNLSVTPEELEALQQMVSTCSAPVAITAGPTGEPIVGNQPDREPTEAPTVSATDNMRYDPDGPDRDCGDFETWQEAQTFFVAAGGPERDTHRLDRDNNGIACESLPGAP